MKFIIILSYLNKYTHTYSIKMQQAVYVGAGHDIIPVLVFRDIKKFIYIDSQPFSEHGTHVYTKDSKYQSKKETLILLLYINDLKSIV